MGFARGVLAFLLLAVGTPAAGTTRSVVGVRTPAKHAASSMPTIAILCYHDISDAPGTPLQTVSPAFLRAQIRVCRAAGWTFVPLRRVIQLAAHPERLPAKTMVLTFDDGFRSFRDRALPVLRAERVPATLAVISAYVDQPPPDMPPLLGWDDLRALDADSLVEVVSHSHDIHRFVTSDPYKDTAPSPVTRRYLLAEGRYENREEYRARLRADLTLAQRTLTARLGHAVPVLVWPYGEHNDMARGVAGLAGFTTTVGLGERAATREDLRAGYLPRIMVTRHMKFGTEREWLRIPPPPMRAVQIDLDDLYDARPAVFSARVDRLVRRVSELGATHAFIEACSDPAGDGRFTAAWFTNHQVFTRADVWGMVAAKLAQARLHVWARIPTMNLTWVRQRHPEWRIVESRTAAPARGPRPGADAFVASAVAAWPTRLSPDLPDVRRAAIDFVTDLAVYTPIEGVLFDDDAFMAPGERLAVSRSMDPQARADTIEALLAACRGAVRAWRPDCEFGRSVPAPVVEADGVHAGLSQDFGRIARDDGLVVVMAYAWAAGHGADASAWVGRLGRRAVTRWNAARGAAQTTLPPAAPVLELQTYDGSGDRWIPAARLGSMVAALRRAGVANVGLCPVTADDGEFSARMFERAAPAPMASGDAAP